MPDTMHFTTMCEVEASEFFPDEGVNWQYCMKHATFVHKDACEFIIHCGDGEFTDSTAEQMKNFGCTEGFIAAYKLAAASGAVRVMFYV